MNEVWKPIPGFESKYEASTLGRIKVIKKSFRGRFPVGYILKPSKHYKSGYYSVMLTRSRNSHQRILLHRIILKTFCGDCPTGMEASHRDGLKINNSISNLEWKTHSENEKDKVGHGTAPIGQKNPRCKLSDAQVLKIKSLIKTGESQYKIADKFDIWQAQVSQIKRGIIWSHIK